MQLYGVSSFHIIFVLLTNSPFFLIVVSCRILFWIEWREVHVFHWKNIKYTVASRNLKANERIKFIRQEKRRASERKVIKEGRWEEDDVEGVDEITLGRAWTKKESKSW